MRMELFDKDLHDVGLLPSEVGPEIVETGDLQHLRSVDGFQGPDQQDGRREEHLLRQERLKLVGHQSELFAAQGFERRSRQKR